MWWQPLSVDTYQEMSVSVGVSVLGVLMFTDGGGVCVGGCVCLWTERYVCLREVCTSAGGDLSGDMQV